MKNYQKMPHFETFKCGLCEHFFNGTCKVDGIEKTSETFCNTSWALKKLGGGKE